MWGATAPINTYRVYFRDENRLICGIQDFDAGTELSAIRITSALADACAGTAAASSFGATAISSTRPGTSATGFADSMSGTRRSSCEPKR